MGIGRDLGLQLRQWIAGGLDLNGSPALANRLIDALGAEPTLRGPLRDLAAQPLTLRVLRLRGAEQQAALQALRQLLAETYSPRVLAELLDLLEAATGLSVPRPEAAPLSGAEPLGAEARGSAGGAEWSGSGAASMPLPLRPRPGDPPVVSSAEPAAVRADPSRPLPASAPSAAPVPVVRRWPPLLRRRRGWEAQLRAIAPGLLAGACGALVLAWGAQEFDHRTFEPLGWSTGSGLAAVLVLLQLLSLLPPLRPLRRRWLLDLPASGDPHRLWSWISAPWLHRLSLEALLNGLLLQIVLGATPLAAGPVVLRYVLSSLLTLAGAVLVGRRYGVSRSWGGASGAVAALIALAAVLSLLQGQPHSFRLGELAIPAWVLLLVNAGLQLSWQLPRQDLQDGSRPLQRLWSSTWWWGTLAGAAWALITRASELLGPLLKGAGHG